ncbi:ATP-grasp domain-containing protein [Tengunoibacter tsumagoiensis]|uniref:Phosphoribosylglycinamide synthetase n=1 Tax=Tengunoibacter tsumagoiensis TaxID=2014871 RepID=A0A402A913_9CHLR|nr:ATP-grasp domain-containing protein [Tengunoibacter tsumagoiensis]GCE15619.1 phosphoribosylglycinamide synthetase [Tengunoibacter tsumagoiensis]
MSKKKNLLVVASSLNPKLLKTPKGMGLRVILAAREAPADPSLYDVFLPVEHKDEKAVVDVVKHYVTTQEPIDAVACFHEGSIHAAARVVDLLQVPGNSYQSVRTMRDKYLTSIALKKANVPAPRTALVVTLDEAYRAAEEIGYPLIIKPQAGAVSQGVVKVHHPEELKEAYQVISTIFQQEYFERGAQKVANLASEFYMDDIEGVLLQEFVPGFEVAIDLVYGQGEYLVLAIHDKPHQWDEPYFIERMYVTPSHFSEAVQQALIETAIRGLKAVGAETGAAHVELRVTETGPKIIEINGRLGGTTAYVQESILTSTGLWGPEEYLRVVLGEAPTLKPVERKPAGFVGVEVEQPGRIESFAGVEETLALPGVLGIRWYLKPGDSMVLGYPENPYVFFAHVLVEGPSYEEVIATMHKVQGLLRAVVVENV